MLKVGANVTQPSRLRYKGVTLLVAPQGRVITDQSERSVAPPVRTTDRPPRLQRRLFPSSDSSSQYEEDGWRSTNREDSRGSEAGTTESWEFKSTLEAPIARLESLDELETSQVRFQANTESSIQRGQTFQKVSSVLDDA